MRLLRCIQEFSLIGAGSALGGGGTSTATGGGLLGLSATGGASVTVSVGGAAAGSLGAAAAGCSSELAGCASTDVEYKLENKAVHRPSVRCVVSVTLDLCIGDKPPVKGRDYRIRRSTVL
jgi:hypothetical protein